LRSFKSLNRLILNIIIPNNIPAKHELATSIIGTVRHVLSKIIVMKKMIDNIKDKIIHKLVEISIGINHDSKFIVEELLRNMFDVEFFQGKMKK